MRYGDQHWVYHLTRAVALFTLALTATFTGFLTGLRITEAGPITPEETQVYRWFFNALGVGILAIFLWAFIELMAAIWSIKFVRIAAVRIRSAVGIGGGR